MKKRRWTKLDSTLVYKNGNFFSVYEDRVLAPNGEEQTYGVITCNGAVYIVAITDSQKFILVEQHRYPVDQDVVELIAGMVEPGEDAIATAKHELTEEANATAEVFELLGILSANPSRQKVAINAVLARGVKSGMLTMSNQDDNEMINRVWEVSEEELVAMIRRGDITDLATLGALNLYWSKYGFPK